MPETQPQIRYVPAAPQKTPPSRTITRIVLVIVWFIILLIPAFFILMFINGEFSIALGDAPEQKLRVWLVSEIRERGFGIATGSVASRDEMNVCVQTDVRYVLWQGSQESTVYCECFARGDGSAEWEYILGSEGTCAERSQEASP
jgi:hypothetical protein